MVENILIVLTVIAGGGLIAIGMSGVMKNEAYYFQKSSTGMTKVQGRDSMKYNVLYILGGLLWIGYAILRIFGILD